MASASPLSSPQASALRRKLCFMMFLQFFIWGAWFELGFDYIPKLGFNNDWQLPLIFGAFNVGRSSRLFFSTQFADRKFAAEKSRHQPLDRRRRFSRLFFLPGKPGTGEASSFRSRLWADVNGRGLGSVGEKPRSSSRMPKIQ